MKEPRSHRFARNVGWNLLGQGAILAVNFLTLPILVKKMGLEAYGVYVILNAAASYLSILSFGAGPALVKYVAEFRGSKNAELAQAVRYGALFHLLGAGLGALVLAAAAPRLALSVFSVPPALLEQGVFLLRCAAAAAVFAAVCQASWCVLDGLQRFDLRNGLNLAMSFLVPVGAAAILILGGSLAPVGAWYVAVNILVALISAGIALRLVPASAKPGHFAFGAFAAYGLSMAFGPLAWIVTFQFDKLFIASQLPLSELTLYAVPSGLLQRLHIFPAVLAGVLVPMISEIPLAEVQHGLPKLYLRSVRLLLYILLPILSLLFVVMPQFLTLWLGGDFGGRSVWVARLLVLSQVFFVLVFIPNAVAMGRGRPILVSAVAWAQAGVSILSWSLLTRRYGVHGVAAGALLAQALPAMAYLTIVHRTMIGIGARRFIAEGLRGPVLAAGCMVLVIFPVHHLASGWGRLAGLCAAGLLVYAGAAWRLLREDDKEVALRVARLPFQGLARA